MRLSPLCHDGSVAWEEVYMRRGCDINIDKSWCALRLREGNQAWMHPERDALQVRTPVFLKEEMEHHCFSFHILSPAGLNSLLPPLDNNKSSQ